MNLQNIVKDILLIKICGKDCQN